MLVDWMRITSWLRNLGTSEPEIVAEARRYLPDHTFHVDATTTPPGVTAPPRPATPVKVSCRNYGAHETCASCGHIFTPDHTSDIEYVTGQCQPCWTRRRNNAHNRGDHT